MSKAASFQYTNPLSEDPLQGFKDCLSEFSHRRDSCPTDPFASPLVSPEVSDSSTNSKLHNPEDHPPLSPRSHSLTSQVKANQVFALQEGPQSQGARRKPRVYKVKCDEIRGWVLSLEENVSLLDPACHLVAVKKDGRLGLRSGLAQGRLLRCNPQLELGFVRGNLESWEAWSLRGETLDDCTLRNRRFKKELNVSTVTIGEVVDSPGNVRLTHAAVLAAEALAYPGPYVSSSAKKSPLGSSRGLQNGGQLGGGSMVSEKVRFFDAQQGESSGRKKLSRGLGLEFETARGESDGAESVLREIDGGDDEERQMDGCDGERTGGGMQCDNNGLDGNLRGDLERNMAALERGHVAGWEENGLRAVLEGNGQKSDGDGRLLDGHERLPGVNGRLSHGVDFDSSVDGRSQNGTASGTEANRPIVDGTELRPNGTGQRPDGYAPVSDEADVVLSDAFRLDGAEAEAQVLVKTALVNGLIRREVRGSGLDDGRPTGASSNVRTGGAPGEETRGEGVRAAASGGSADEFRRLAAENDRLRRDLALEVETAAFQRSDLLRQLERERHRAEQLQLELQQARSGRSTPSPARRRLTFQEDRPSAASVAERVEGQLADAVLKLNGAQEPRNPLAAKVSHSASQESFPPRTILQRLVAWTRVMFRTSRAVLPWFVCFAFGIWFARLNAKRRQLLKAK